MNIVRRLEYDQRSLIVCFPSLTHTASKLTISHIVIFTL